MRPAWIPPRRLAPRIAWIFGSAAKGELRSDSDIDLFIVGDAPFAAVVETLADPQRLLIASPLMDDEEKREMLARLNQGMVEAVPYNNALGLQALDFGPGWATVRVPYRQELVGNPDTGVMHGGVITGMVDAVCGLAVFMKLKVPTRIATLDLRIDYLKPATPPLDVRARAECYKLTKQVAFVRAVAFHDDPADPIASAAGTFMIFDEGRSPVAEALKIGETK